MEEKRKRSINFTTEEEMLLINLVKKHKEIIECKKSDTVANRLKLEAWRKIESEFNQGSNSNFRDIQVLRKKYDNLKKQTKKKFADEKLYVKGTGGGPHKPATTTDIDDEIKDLLGKRLEGFESKFGSDKGTTSELVVEDMDYVVEDVEIDGYSYDQFHKYGKQLKNPEASEICVNMNSPSTSVMTETSTDATQDWSFATPQKLKTPISKPLQKSHIEHKRECKLPKALQSWAEAKSSLQDFKMEMCRREFEQKLKHTEELHEQQLLIRRTDAELQRKIAWEQHEKKMEILELEKKYLLHKLKN